VAPTSEPNRSEDRSYIDGFVIAVPTPNNKATRDAGMKKMLEDPRMDPSTPGNPPMPFDGKRMIFGGFEAVVEVNSAYSQSRLATSTA
jgi:uncharacterized protein YbaA (DUF1428 family)